MKKLQKGFTLIELLIVVTIIAILAAISIPLYQDYVTRARWSDNIGALAFYRTATAICLQNNDAQLTACDTPDEVLADLPAADQVLPALKFGTVTQTPKTAALVIVGNAQAGSCTVTIALNADQVPSVLQWVYTTTGANCGKNKTGV